MAGFGGNTLLTKEMVAAGASPENAPVVTRMLREAGFLSTENRGKAGLATVEDAHAAVWAIAYGAPSADTQKPMAARRLWHLPLVARIEVTSTAVGRETHELRQFTTVEAEAAHVAGEHVRALIEQTCERGRDWLFSGISHLEIWSSNQRLDVVWAGGSRLIFAEPGVRLSGPTEAGFETVGRVGASVLAAAADVVLANRSEAARLGITISTDGLRRALGYAPAGDAASSAPPGDHTAKTEKAPSPHHRGATPFRGQDQTAATRHSPEDFSNPDTSDARGESESPLSRRRGGRRSSPSTPQKGRRL